MKKILMIFTLTALVCVCVTAAHWPALHAKALSYDDSEYLTNNPLVQNPSWLSAKKFLSEVINPSTVGGYYQPLSMISLMLDYKMAGNVANLLPFHRTSLVLHIANTALVIIFLYLLFGSILPAALVGLLFGLHPMTVETIPWIGERKTLLAAFFSLWALILYVRYAQKKSMATYAVSLLMYILALMSKPTSTPLPVLFLLLDFWPLKRLGRSALLEKIPFFVIGAISAGITIISQSSAAVVRTPTEFGLLHIPLTICYSVVFYLCKIFWPVNLSSHYPFPDPVALSNPQVVAAVIAAVVLLLVLCISLRRRRSLITGFLFFFICILPTMQILRFSDVIASDKFAYLPSVGFLIVSAWAVSKLWQGGKSVRVMYIRRGLIIFVVVLLGIFETVGLRGYLAKWKDSETLFRHMVTMTPNAAVPRFGLGCCLQQLGRLDEALEEFQRAVDLNPRYPQAHHNLAKAFEEKGQLDKALVHYTKALKLKPMPAYYISLAYTYIRLNQIDKAIELYEQALQMNPGYSKAHCNLAAALMMQNRVDEAAQHLEEAIRINPDYADAHSNYGALLMLQGKTAEAIGHYQQALRINPNHINAANGLEKALSIEQ